MIYLDSHVVAWLYASGTKLLSPVATELIDGSDDVRISPMVRLELRYLYEIGRVKQPPSPVLDVLQSVLGLSVCPAPFAAVVHGAETLDWTRDPFDRLIVAQAALHDAPLVTKDETLRSKYHAAVW